MTVTLDGLVREHEMDLLWIIALWLAIHGGDPAPFEIDQTTEVLATALVAHLAEKGGHSPLSIGSLQKALRPIGVTLSQNLSGGVHMPVANCREVIFNGKSYLICTPITPPVDNR